MHYLLTITKSGGLTTAEIQKICDWFAGEYEKVVLNVEPHKSGLLHLHAYVQSPCKVGGSLHKKLTRFLVAEVGFVMSPRTLKVQAAKDAGACDYVLKDVTAEKPITLCKGWAISELLKNRQLRLKKLTPKNLQGDDRVINQCEVVPLILRFAKDETTTITDKHSFKLVVIAMMRQGYSFSRIKMAVTYAEVMVRVGDDRAADDWLDMQLTGMT